MTSLETRSTHPAPAPRPQPMAFHGGRLYVGCWETRTLYAVDPETWTTIGETPLPGVPYGIASLGGQLRLVISIGEDDDRYLYRVEPGSPVSDAARVPCPDMTGSHLTTNGRSLFLVQQTNRRMLELDEAGGVLGVRALASRCAGVGFAGDRFHLIVVEGDFDRLTFASLDLATSDAEPVLLGDLSPEARGLAYDGASWWTALREENTITSFASPIKGG